MKSGTEEEFYEALAKINRNMRCIEMKAWGHPYIGNAAINRNMRCIEIMELIHGSGGGLRLIET